MLSLLKILGRIFIHLESLRNWPGIHKAGGQTLPWPDMNLWTRYIQTYALSLAYSRRLPCMRVLLISLQQLTRAARVQVGGSPSSLSTKAALPIWLPQSRPWVSHARFPDIAVQLRPTLASLYLLSLGHCGDLLQRFIVSLRVGQPKALWA